MTTLREDLADVNPFRAKVQIAMVLALTDAGVRGAVHAQVRVRIDEARWRSAAAPTSSSNAADRSEC